MQREREEAARLAEEQESARIAEEARLAEEQEAARISEEARLAKEREEKAEADRLAAELA